MIAFLKRRWILISCVIVLLACSVIDLLRVEVFGMRRHASVVTFAMNGIRRGAFRAFRGDFDPSTGGTRYEPEVLFLVHRPLLGSFPVYSTGLSGGYDIAMPLWLPLCAVLGWLVFRELRWREKRAKAVDANPAQL